MVSYVIKLKKRIELAHNTIGFVFDKPSDFTFIPGQFGGFILNHPDEKQAKNKIRSLTLVNPPYADEIMFATRIRDSIYKNFLMQMPIGTELKLNAAFGSFTLHHDTNIPAVYICGGIGVAPARCVALQAAKDQRQQQIFLFYSNRRPEDAAFLRELVALQQENPYYQCIATMTNMQDSQQTWQGETGYIDEAMLKRYITDLTVPIYYVCGPSRMVTAVRKTLLDAGVQEEKIQTEEFPGY